MFYTSFRSGLDWLVSWNPCDCSGIEWCIGQLFALVDIAFLSRFALLIAGLKLGFESVNCEDMLCFFTFLMDVMFWCFVLVTTIEEVRKCFRLCECITRHKARSVHGIFSPFHLSSLISEH